MEGVFTFFIAMTCFRNRLGLDKEYEKYGKRQMEAVGTTKSVTLADLNRAIFNPRCHTIPFSNVISVFTIVAIVGASIALGKVPVGLLSIVGYAILALGQSSNMSLRIMG